MEADTFFRLYPPLQRGQAFLSCRALRVPPPGFLLFSFVSHRFLSLCMCVENGISRVADSYFYYLPRFFLCGLIYMLPPGCFTPFVICFHLSPHQLCLSLLPWQLTSPLLVLSCSFTRSSCLSRRSLCISSLPHERCPPQSLYALMLLRLYPAYLQSFRRRHRV